MKRSLVIMTLLLTTFSVASAQIYKCTAPATGKTNFTDTPCNRIGSSQVSGGNNSVTTTTDLSSIEMTKRIGDAENAIHKAIAEHMTKQARHIASKDEDPRFRARLHDNSWRFKIQKACTLEQNVTRREDFDKDRFIKCTYQQVESHINQLAELSGDHDISQILTSSMYPDIERRADTTQISSETVLLKKGKEGIDQALAQGLLTVATQADLKKWQDKAGVSTLHPVFQGMQKYNIKGKFELAGDLGGANAVVFLAPTALVIPSGDRGHSIILIMDNGSCLGQLCDMIK